MAVDPARVPHYFFLSVPIAGASLQLTDGVNPCVFGALYILNSGAADCWINTSDPAVIPAASDGNGRVRLPAGRSMNIDDTAITIISANALAITGLQITALKRPGSNGYGNT